MIEKRNDINPGYTRCRECTNKSDGEPDGLCSTCRDTKKASAGSAQRVALKSAGEDPEIEKILRNPNP